MWQIFGTTTMEDIPQTRTPKFKLFNCELDTSQFQDTQANMKER